MLGGYGKVHYTDIGTSSAFLDEFAARFAHTRVLDCGAGMGRVTKHLLLPRFEKVDMVEPSGVQLDKAREYVESDRVHG